MDENRAATDNTLEKQNSNNFLKIKENRSQRKVCIFCYLEEKKRKGETEYPEIQFKTVFLISRSVESTD